MTITRNQVPMSISTLFVRATLISVNVATKVIVCFLSSLDLVPGWLADPSLATIGLV